MVFLLAMFTQRGIVTPMNTAAIRNAADRLAAILAELEAIRDAGVNSGLEDAISFIQSAIDSLDALNGEQR